MTVRLSARGGGNLQENRIARALAARPPRYDLSVSNPTAVGLAPSPERLAELLHGSDVAARLTRYEPAPEGLLAARDAVASYYREAHGADVDPAQILLTASTSEGYGYLFKLLCDPGDEVLVPTPSYPLLDELARLESVRLARYELDRVDRGWVIDVELIERAITPRTRAIIVVSPNNPTGTVLTHKVAAQLDALCAARELPLILDEVFADYVWDEPSERAVGPRCARNAVTFTLSGLSKVVGLPQLKLGWVVVSGPQDEARRLVERLVLIADAYLSVATPIQLAAPALLAHRRELQAPIVERVRANRSWLAQSLDAHPSGLRLLPSPAGWSAIVELPRYHTDEEWVLRLLEQASVYVQPGYLFDLPDGAVVLSLLVTNENLNALALAVSRCIETFTD